MADKFKVGDLVWAKMKGFPAWPGRVIQPKAEVKKPSNKKNSRFVFFFGSENYAWIPEDTIWSYARNRDRFTLASRIPKGFKEALEAIEDALKALPEEDLSAEDLPSIEEEIAQIFPNRSSSPQKDYSRDPHNLKKPAVRRHSEPSKPKSKDKELNHSTNKMTKQSRHERKSSEPAIKTVKAKVKEAREVLRKKMALPPKSPGKVTKEVPKRRSYLASKAMEESIADKAQMTTIKRMASPAKGTPKAKKFKVTAKIPPSPAKTLLDATRIKPKIQQLHTVISAGVKSRVPEITGFPQESDQNDASSAPHSSNAAVSSAGTQIEESLLAKPASKDIIPTPMRIGFLGLGIMGQGMVMNLLRSGHEVTVWNRTPLKCREFVKAGALKGNCPSEVLQSCDITFSCVSDSTAVKDLVFGNSGVLQGISRGKCYVEMSTIDEETMQDVAEAITARGGVFLEAPVVGSRVPALEGQLIILAAGDRKLFDDCYSCFEAMAKKSLYLGDEVGGATRMKLIVNMVMGTVMASLAEGMAMAEKVGLDQEDVAEVLSLGSLSCPTVIHKSQAILNQKYDPHFPLQHQQKDLRLALQLGDKVEQPLYVAASANELYKKARRLGYGDGDISAVYRAASA
ncbi:hypothetical protein ScPMuIL_010650 [Solemya velum]